MTGDQCPWCTGSGNPNKNTPAQYVAAWKHTHALIAKAGVTNAIWVWCGGATGNAAELASNFPGDSYVDWVGFEAFNGDAANWKSMTEVFRPSYDAIAGFSKKPMLVGQTATIEGKTADQKAQWITQGLLTDVPAKQPRIRLVVWFDAVFAINGMSTSDWRIDSTAASLAAFQKGSRVPHHGPWGPLTAMLSRTFGSRFVSSEHDRRRRPALTLPAWHR